jgi:hypothetical protein
VTLPHRRDHNTKGASVITGLRLEAPLAERLVAFAHEHFTDRGRADVAAAACHLLRLALGWAPDNAATAENAPGTRVANVVAGLRIKEDLAAAGRAARRKTRLNMAATVRHLLRQQLGWSAAESLEVEARFTSIAAAKREIMETL